MQDAGVPTRLAVLLYMISLVGIGMQSLMSVVIYLFLTFTDKFSVVQMFKDSCRLMPKYTQ